MLSDNTYMVVTLPPDQTGVGGTQLDGAIVRFITRIFARYQIAWDLHSVCVFVLFVWSAQTVLR